MPDSPIRKKNMKPSSLSGEDAASTTLTIADIKELFALMQANEIAELKLEQQETKIHIVSKGAHVAAPPQVVPVMAGMPPMGMVGMPQSAPVVQAASPQASEPGLHAAAESGKSGTAAQGGNTKTILSPMVGTFYSAASPEAPPFVQVGDSVSEETVLCIIEAMKLMNEIKAEMKGRISRILVENGVPVEYNQPLFLIEP